MHVRLASVLALVLFVLAGCSATTEIGASDLEGTPAPVADGSGDSDDGDRQSELSSREVFETIESSVVYVQSPDDLSSGSGIVIDGGWILTNAHVVDRHQTMRIGRSDGADLGLHPVHAVDWVFDLALVGPITDTSLQAIPRGVSADLGLGSRVLLAGFPDEDTILPTPTLTEGIVSRRRYVAVGDYPFIQVDATIAPGQSGGALVNGWGELVGISGLEFGEGEFGLAFAADEMWPRIDAMVALGGAALPSGPDEFALTGTAGPLRNFGFIVEVEEGSAMDILVTSVADVWVDVQTLGGITVELQERSTDPFRERGSADSLYIDELVEGGEDVIADLDAGFYQVVIGAFGEEIVDVEVSSANPMRTFVDAEEGQVLPVNEVVEGDFDWVRDTDQWELPLQAGQEVTLTVDGIADTIVVVRLNDEAIATSDDESLGMFGTGSRVSFTVEETATYVVEVGTFDQTRWGYLIEALVTDAP